MFFAMELSGIIVKKENLCSTAWSGGVTTQLAIYPEDASYADRNFLWRISTATVEAEKSDFTILPNVSRILMVLEGTLRLIYNGSHEVTLHRFGQDSFSGGWNTESIGRVRDFNLMMKEGCTGSIEALELIPYAPPRLHTADGILHSESFTDAGKNAVAGTAISEIYYALTDAVLTKCLNGDNKEMVEIRLNAGDVYINSYNASGISGKLIARRTADAPTAVVRALIIHTP